MYLAHEIVLAGAKEDHPTASLVLGVVVIVGGAAVIAWLWSKLTRRGR